MLPLSNTRNGSLKPNQAGVESLGARGSGTGGGWAGQERSRAGWTWEAAGSHTYTPSGLRLDTRGFCRLRGCPRNCLAVGRGGDSTGVALWPDGEKEIYLEGKSFDFNNQVCYVGLQYLFLLSIPPLLYPSCRRCASSNCSSCS